MAFRDIGESSNIRQIGRLAPIRPKKKPFYTKVDIRDAMAAYHQASENNWDVGPAVVRQAARMILNRLKQVSQFKGHSSLDKLKRASNADQMEAALDAVWLYAEQRRVLLIA